MIGSYCSNWRPNYTAAKGCNLYIKNPTNKLITTVKSSQQTYLNFQHSPLDDHLLRIYLVKTLPRKNPMGKNQWQRKNSTVFLWTFKCLWMASLKPWKGKSNEKKPKQRKKSKISTCHVKLLLPLIRTWKIFRSMHANTVHHFLKCCSW